jgi:S1-C subfamily serine protease
MRRLLLPLVASGLMLGTAAPGAGAHIRSVRSGSPAHRAGLQPGDVVLSAAGRDVYDDDDLAAALEAPGRKAVAVRRDAAIKILMLAD